MTTQKRIVFTLAACLLFFGSLEIGSRIFLDAYRYRHPIPAAQSIFVSDPVLAFRLKPNYPAKSSRAPNRLINDTGFRGPDFVRDPRRKLILCIGDSGTFGLGSNRAYMEYLQDRINAKGLPYQTLNAGVPGYISTQIITRYRNELRRMKPDIIIFYGGWNDIFTAAWTVGWKPNAVYMQDGNLLQTEIAKKTALQRLNDILGKSAFATLLKMTLKKTGLLRSADVLPDRQKNNEPVAMNIMGRNLRELIRLAASDGAVVYLVNVVCVKPSMIKDSSKKGEFISPDFDIIDQGDKVNNELNQIAVETKTRVINPATCVTPELSIRDFHDPLHFTDNGSEKLAECVFKEIFAK